MSRTLPLFALALTACASLPGAALAQRAAENAVTSATDAFGATVGSERTGLYTTTDVRGFSPVVAGNRRLDGLYFDFSGPALSSRMSPGSVVRIGLPALAYPFPAPTGIVDYGLRSSGDGTVVSLSLVRQAYGAMYTELDVQTPVIPGVLSLAAGAMVSKDKTVEDADGDYSAYFISPRLRFERGELTAFWSRADNRIEMRPLVVTAGAYLPPDVEPGVFYGQRWAINDTRQNLVGLLGRYELAEGLTLRAGLFDARTVRPQSNTLLFTGVQRDGAARELVAADPELRGRWTSGEARLTYERRAGDVHHALVASVRGRDRFLTNGESAATDVGPARLGVVDAKPRPAFVFAPVSSNSVKQWTGGLAYLGRWAGVGELNAGLQKTRYSNLITRGGVRAETTDAPWLYNATIALTPRDWLAVYAGYTRGLEESAAVPQNAANRSEALPAAQTTQRDAGVRLALGKLRLVGGVFEVEKPYYALDQGNVFAELGQVSHRGAEFSLVGPVTDKLTLVAGLVLMSPRVTGEARVLGRVGERPVGTAETYGRIDLDYRVEQLAGLSLTATLIHNGERIAGTRAQAELGGEQLATPAFTTLDLGIRYRFRIGDKPAMLRVLASNVFDERGWKVVAGNAFQAQDSRRLGVFLTADL